MEKSLVHIGAQKETVIEARKSIMAILTSSAEQATKQKALDTLSELCKAGNNSFSNCSFIGQSETNWKSKTDITRNH